MSVYNHLIYDMKKKRPLKRPRLGPPDIYPQEAKQKEDELTSSNVKQGFTLLPHMEEFGTARNYNVTASKVGSFFNAILSKKEELMTLQDTGRKKQQINLKENFWPVTGRTKATLDTWFKDLAGTKPLASLAKRAPSFNKKEEIFAMLCENQVSMQRASWFIKLSSAYTVAQSEAKSKKRQMPDPATEWTGTMIKFMRELIPKLHEHYYQGVLPEKLQTSATNASTPTSQASSTTSITNTVPTPLTSPASSMHSPGNMGSTPTTSILAPPSPQDEHKHALRQWNYCIQLSKYMYEEGLLDKHEFLNWILDLLDKVRSQPTDDGLLKLFLPLALQYMSDFVQSERLSRRLAYLVCKKMGHMINSAVENGHIFTQDAAMAPANGSVKTETQETQNPEGSSKMQENSDYKEKSKIVMANGNTPGNPYTFFNEYMSCPHHRDLILQWSAIIQVITIECATSLVWCGIGENRASSIFIGSPLDHLPISPSALPMPPRFTEANEEIRKQLRVVEESIKTRSKHAEARWCTDKWQSITGNTGNRILSTLDALDSHCFDRMDTSNSLETLYVRIFPSSASSVASGGSNGGSKDHSSVSEGKETKVEYDPNQDAPIIKILCEWAVSWQRWGEHRAMAVAWLLDKRQTEVTSSNENEATNGNSDDKDSISSGAGVNGSPVFQKILMNFLDNDAPVLEENGNPQNRSQFTNLVHLFSELIRHDVFSHDGYMCTLIARGDLTTKGISATQPHTNVIPPGPISNPTKASPGMHPGLDEDVFAGIEFKSKIEEFDDSNVDDDLDKLLQHIKSDQQNSLDAPDSPKDPENSTQGASHIGIGTDSTVSRHFLYTKHFPLSQDGDVASQHDCNQRYILLFGVGKERDEKKHAVKKMSKEICKLFSKKFSIDVAEGGKVKKHSRSEFNFESTTNKCQSMSYFDQHFVTWQCAVTVQEMLNSFALGNSNYLPVQEHVAFLFDLMEMAFNIYGLIDMCIQILKELPEVESQLIAKSSTLVRNYTTSLSLYVVGVLRRYHCCLLLSPEQTSAVFEGLCKVVKHVTNPGDCSSAERCILAYLFDLYSSCSLLKTKPQPTEPFHNAYPKIKQALYSTVQIQASTHIYNREFMVDIFAHPKRGGKIETGMGRLLNESGANRYSFVCNAILAVVRENDNDRLNDIAATCAELTACCNTLSAEWLGALVALCGSSNETFYPEIVSQVDVQNLSIHNALAVFTCILVARHCFSLENFVASVALPALVTVCNGAGRDMTPEAEAGARLTCHLLLRLFKTIEIPQPGLYSVSTSPNPIISGPACNIKLSCDRHLLAAAHKNIAVAPVLAVLKGILVVGDAMAHKASSVHSGGKRSGLNTPVHPGSTPKSMGTAGDLSHILGTSEFGLLGNCDEPMLDSTQQSHSVHSENASSLYDFAQHVLRQICSQEWVLERCLQNAEELCQPGMLIDTMLTPKQAQRLLHMICYAENESNMKAEMDQKSIIVRILENLEQWSLRISWLDLQLMFKQTNSSSAELTNWLDTVARAAIDVFQVSMIGTKQEKPSIWLVAPLVSKLPSQVQGRILRVAGQVLESTNFFGAKGRDSGNGSSNGGGSCSKRKATTQLSHQPFLGLVLTCLKGQDEQKEGLLTSLHSQLSQFLQSNKEMERIGGIEDPQGRESMLDALQLRFSLVGGMFDSIQKNAASTTDWAILLAQLISQGVIDLTNNSELFTTVLDMLATLIHSTLVSDSQSERDDTKKSYTNLMKKLRKELGDKNNASVKFVRQLLPLSKQTCEVIACDSASSLTDTKGNKISGFDSIDKKHGLRIADKQRVSVWDLLEGHKNPAPLSWAWFGAVKMERKPLAYEDTHRLLKYHTHSLVKPSSYFYEPLPLPPEDLEPLPEKPKEDMKADTPSSVDQSPGLIGANGRVRMKGRRPRKPKPGPANMPINQPQQQPQAPPQQQPQMPNNPMGPMQMNMANQMNQGMQQYQQGPGAMQQNPGQMMPGPQMQQGNPMQAPVGAQAQQPQNPGGIAFGVGGPQMGQGGPQQPGPQGQQQGPQQWGVFNPMQQQQQQLMYNQQTMGQQMNRFERPSMANQSKQALSNMLRQRHPFIGGNQATSANFNMQQQRQQQIPFMRNTLRASLGGQMGPGGQQSMNPVMGQNMGQMGQAMGGQGMGGQTMGGQTMGGQAMGGQAMGGQTMGGQAMGGQGMGPGSLMTQQSQMGQNPMSQAQSAPQAMMSQAGGMMASASGGMMTQGQTTAMGQAPGGMMQQQQQQAPVTGAGGATGGMVGQTMGAGGMQTMQQGGGQQAMFQNQQYQGMAQNFGGYGGQAMNQQAAPQAMMTNFSQMSAQRTSQAEYIAQQRALQANRGQYMQPAPNVTMNNMVAQGAAPPYSRQGQTGGKPTQAQQQQFQQVNQVNQQRIRQQMMMQQQQSMGQQPNPQGMGQGQNQGMGQQQTPALVAQLQRQMPNQQNMMGQQYPHQPPPY
ncbi:mediator of RNA polymerase II transcription subunit 12 isoform X2 [Phlebotomus argentipes]|uniref:mediator of RNA polymerase II transcription subunit 12 isoform X2 n=1 Tax=Phlebotomus argentipes TaxID=94469 RepID=UPI002892F0D4|nr:mediator of RNA polymerase II transcription subunit 12 isoform X2 [Phlebotomus argentipes]